MKSSVTSELPVINHDELIDRMMGSVQMAERMLHRFIDASAAECDALESMVRAGNRREVVSLAHRHKGTARTLSAARVAQVAAHLEAAAETEACSDLLEIVDQIRSTHQELRSVVDDGLASRTDRGDARRSISDER